MKVTTITFRRTLNLGNYNSAQLEKTALADEFEDQEVATQNLIESVLRQLHEEEIQNQIDKEIRDQRNELAALKTEYNALKKQLKILEVETEEKEQDLVDDIIFNPGSRTSNDPADF